ncbi:hypothetical protein GCM10027265_25160 [Jatrophihabitans fulvus]
MRRALVLVAVVIVGVVAVFAVDLWRLGRLADDNERGARADLDTAVSDFVEAVRGALQRGPVTPAALTALRGGGRVRPGVGQVDVRADGQTVVLTFRALSVRGGGWTEVSDVRCARATSRVNPAGRVTGQVDDLDCASLPTDVRPTPTIALDR